MYVCICHAVTESDIKRAAETGVTNFRELAHRLYVAQQCGTCARYAKDYLDNVLSESMQSKIDHDKQYQRDHSQTI